MNEDFRKSPPVPLAPVPFNVPVPAETTLANGLKVVLLEDHKLPLISFRLIIRSGDAHEPATECGLSTALAAMLAEGTANYSSLALAEKIERLGASLSASSGNDTTSVAASSLSHYRTEMVKLLAEVALRPTFPEAELDLYRRNTIDGLKFQRSQAGFLADEQISRIIFGTHPYARVSPTADDVNQINREKLTAHHARTFLPNASVLIVVGDFAAAELMAEIEQEFGSWQSGVASEVTFPALPARKGRTLTIVDRPGSAQANIVIANPAIERNHPDFFRAMVMNQILGAGASSRIFMNIREDKGYTYGAYTKFDMRRTAGMFEATAEVRTDVVGPSLKEFFYEFERIRAEEVTPNELDDAKNYLTGVFPIRAETQEGLTGFLVQQQIYELPADYLLTYRENISAITIDDVADVAERYVLPDEMAIVLVGDAVGIIPQVGEFASAIEIFDNEGNPLELASFTAPKADAEVDLSGDWDLMIDFQGQQMPVGLSLSQTGNEVTGKLTSMLGEGVIERGLVTGTDLAATAVTDMGGRPLELAITGKFVDGELRGSLNTPMIPEPLGFSGSRK